MRFVSDTQRRAVFAKLYPSWMRQDISESQKDAIMSYKNRLDANKILYDIIDGEPVTLNRQLRDMLRWNARIEKYGLEDNEFATKLLYSDAHEMIPVDKIIIPSGIGTDLSHDDVVAWQSKLPLEHEFPPLLIDDNYTLWDGRHRLLTEMEAGTKEVPVKFKNEFSKMKIKDGYVSLIPFNLVNDPTIGLGYKERTLNKWLKQLKGKAVPPLILRPSTMDKSRYTIWDGRHRYAVMEMQKWPLIPARIYDEGKLVYPKSFKRKKFEGDETKQARLGEEYKYLW